MGSVSRAAISQEQTAVRVRLDADSMSLRRIALRAKTQNHAMERTRAAVDMNAIRLLVVAASCRRANLPFRPAVTVLSVAQTTANR